MLELNFTKYFNPSLNINEIVIVVRGCTIFFVIFVFLICIMFYLVFILKVLVAKCYCTGWLIILMMKHRNGGL